MALSSMDSGRSLAFVVRKSVREILKELLGEDYKAEIAKRTLLKESTLLNQIKATERVCNTKIVGEEDDRIPDKVEWIQGFCDLYGYPLERNYSGRGMLGKTCIGIVCQNSYQTLVELADYLHRVGIGSVSLALGEICKDEMGLNQILYLKGISVK